MAAHHENVSVFFNVSLKNKELLQNILNQIWVFDCVAGCGFETTGEGKFFLSILREKVNYFLSSGRKF